jgi:hypothetical protein
MFALKCKTCLVACGFAAALLEGQLPASAQYYNPYSYGPTTMTTMPLGNGWYSTTIPRCRNRHHDATGERVVDHDDPRCWNFDDDAARQRMVDHNGDAVLSPIRLSLARVAAGFFPYRQSLAAILAEPSHELWGWDCYAIKAQWPHSSVDGNGSHAPIPAVRDNRRERLSWVDLTR